MSGPVDLLVDGYDRLREIVHDVVGGPTSDDLAWQPAPVANSIGWLVWHLTRVQDSHIAELAQSPQVWTGEGWAERFDLPFEPSTTGYGQPPEEAGRLRTSSQVLTGYYDAVHARTLWYLRRVTADALDRVVDERWDPPVTLAVRLVSVLVDDLQHAGQAAYVRGLLARR